MPYDTKIGLADGDLREASALGGDVIRILDSLLAEDIVYESPADDIRVLEEVSTQTRAAIAKLDDARSRLAALRDPAPDRAPKRKPRSRALGC